MQSSSYFIHCYPIIVLHYRRLCEAAGNGDRVRAPGDIVVYEVLVIPNNLGMYMPDHAADISYFFAHIAVNRPATVV